MSLGEKAMEKGCKREREREREYNGVAQWRKKAIARSWRRRRCEERGGEVGRLTGRRSAQGGG